MVQEGPGHGARTIWSQAAGRCRWVPEKGAVCFSSLAGRGRSAALGQRQGGSWCRCRRGRCRSAGVGIAQAGNVKRQDGKEASCCGSSFAGRGGGARRAHGVFSKRSRNRRRGLARAVGMHHLGTLGSWDLCRRQSRNSLIETSNPALIRIPLAALPQRSTAGRFHTWL